MTRRIISTENAPAIGPYSQAIRAGNTVYLSGQVPLDPATGELVTGDFEHEARRVFENLQGGAGSRGDARRRGAGDHLPVDMAQFPVVNAVIAQYFREPYPARVTIGVASLPRGARVEVDFVLVT